MVYRDITEEQLRQIIREAVCRALDSRMIVVPAGVSNRHIHLDRASLDVLFGRNYTLTPMKELSQPGQFAARECLEVIGPKGSFPRVRVLGPLRKESQVELSRTDCYTLGINAPVRSSGDLKGTPGIRLKGPEGVLELKSGVIIADRHIHLSPEEAEAFGLRDKDRVDVVIGGIKPGVMNDVLIRSGKGHSMDFHIDTDDANAFGLTTGSLVAVSIKS